MQAKVCSTRWTNVQKGFWFTLAHTHVCMGAKRAPQRLHTRCLHESLLRLLPASMRRAGRASKASTPEPQHSMGDAAEHDVTVDEQGSAARAGHGRDGSRRATTPGGAEAPGSNRATPGPMDASAAAHTDADHDSPGNDATRTGAAQQQQQDDDGKGFGAACTPPPPGAATPSQQQGSQQQGERPAGRRLPQANPIVARLAADEAGISASEDRPAYEAFVAQRAKSISALRAKAEAKPFADKRQKDHWDHLLEEMEWLAKDFIRCVRGRVHRRVQLQVSCIIRKGLGVPGSRAVHAGGDSWVADGASKRS